MSKRMPAATALGAFLIATSLSSTAAEWPTKPIRLVVPTAAGGAGDLMARTFANALAPALGQQFVIDNRPGAGGAIATEAIVRVEPDGYTLMLSGLPYHVIGPAMNPNAGFDPIRDFTHIAFFGGSPMVLVAHPSLGVQRFAQLSALSAEGTSGIDYVSAGFGSVGNMVAEYLASRAKLNLRHIPYKGGSAAVVDLVAGHIKVGSLTWSTALPHVRAGILRPLAISTAQRLPDFPDLPTFAELGFDDIVVTAWFSLSGPAGIPGGIVDRLNRLVNGAMTSAEVRQTLERDASLTKPMTPAEFTAFVRSEVDKWTPVVRTFAKPR